MSKSRRRKYRNAWHGQRNLVSLVSATVPFGDEKGNGVSRQAPTTPRLPPQLYVGSERPLILATGKPGRPGASAAGEVHSDNAGCTHQPGDLPSQASPQPPDGEYSVERTPVSATREAWFCERVGVRPLFGHTHYCLHLPCSTAYRRRRPPDLLPRHQPITARGIRGCETNTRHMHCGRQLAEFWHCPDRHLPP